MAGALFGLGIAALLALFWDTARSIGFIWWNVPAFSHGFLIVPISGYLVWLQRGRLARVVPRSSLLLGLGIVAPAALTWLVGETAGIQLIQQLALVAMMQGLALAVLGRRAVLVIAFPLFYLYFAVPIGTSLIPPLQDLTAVFVVRVLQTIGIPVYLDGIFIQIPSGSFEVAEACAGVRFLIASVSLGVVFAYIFYRDLWRRALFVVLSIIVPIIANGFRASGIVLLAHYSDYRIAASTDHITYGLIFLSLVLLCLLVIGYWFRERGERPMPSIAPASAQDVVPPFRFAIALAGVLSVAGASWAYAGHIKQGPARPDEMTLSWPAVSPPWLQVAPPPADWRPSFAKVDHEAMQGYAAGERRVDLYIAYYAYQKQGAEVVNWFNSLVGGRPWKRAGSGRIQASPAGRAMEVAYERIVAPKRQRIVWYWYWVDGRFTASPYIAKLYEVKVKLLGGRQAAAVIALAADYRDSPSEAHRTLADFLGHAPLIEGIFDPPGS